MADAGEMFKVISGGQTGADQAGLRAARAAGLVTGGWAPRGWLTEAGPAPRLAREFGLVECPEPEGEPFLPRWKWDAACYVARTRRNAGDAPMTIYFTMGSGKDSRGYQATRRAVPMWHTFLSVGDTSQDLPPDQFARNWGPSMWDTVNVAGNRESKSPGIGEWVEEYLTEVFRLVREGRAGQV